MVIVFCEWDFFACMYICASCACSVLGGQKRVSDLLEMELQVIRSYLVWVLGTKPGYVEEQKMFLTAEPTLKSLPSTL